MRYLKTSNQDIEVAKEIIHSTLKCSRRIAEALRHMGGINQEITQYQYKLLSIGRREMNFLISTGQIHT